jgi:hypothetical protein
MSTPMSEPTDTAVRPTSPAERLLAEADQHVRLGRLTEAASLIRQAAAVYASEGQTEDEARCLVLAATAGRLGGAVTAAQNDAAAAVRLLPEPTSSVLTSSAGTSTAGSSATGSTGVQATAELAESLVAAGQPAAAVGEYTNALERLPEPPAEPLVRAVLLRKRVWRTLWPTSPTRPIDDLDTDARLFADGGLPRARRAVLVESATLASERSTAERGAWHHRRARAVAAEAADHDALADLDLLDARQAVTRGDLESAIGLTVRARQRALDGVSAVKYARSTASRR